MEVFDEDKAVDVILESLKRKGIDKNYTADDILEVIDIIWDYYEDNGLLDLDMAEDSNSESNEDADKVALIEHVVKMIKKDRGTKIDTDHIPAIVEAELAYEAQCDEF